MANTAAKKITYDSKPVQVESAIRDGTGKVINTTYATKAEAVTDVSYDSTNKKIKKTVNGTTSDVMTLSTVATSGSYADLSNKPSIPVNATSGAVSPSAATANGFYYISSNVNSLSGNDANPVMQYHTSNLDFRILATAYSTSWVQQIATDFRSNNMYFRRKDNGTWKDWVKISTSEDLASYAPLASPALTGTPTAPTATAGTNTTQIATTAFVQTAIAELPQAMIFRGTLGTGGTITSLPTAGSTYEGDVYKVITAGTYASQSAKVGDTFICGKTGTSTYSWILIPSGDEPSGTVTNIATGVGLTGGPITTTGTIKAKLKSETNATYDSNSITNTSGRQYAVVPDKTNGYLSVNVPWTDNKVLQENSDDLYGVLDVDLPILINVNETDTTARVGFLSNVVLNSYSGTIKAPHFYNSTTSSSLDFIVGSTFQLTEVD